MSTEDVKYTLPSLAMSRSFAYRMGAPGSSAEL
jgi:hypothetical protein